MEKHFPSGKITSFSGRDATPDSYLKNSPGMYKFIHLATHGTPNAIDPLQSAIILSSGKDGNFKLLARDIIDRKVRLNAELVTISACEGVGTQLQSLEGLLGLEWAFMRAGAHQVVAAVWDQDDAVTPALMDDFYGQLAQGKSATDALHHAKLSILHAGGFHACSLLLGITPAIHAVIKKPALVRRRPSCRLLIQNYSAAMRESS